MPDEFRCYTLNFADPIFERIFREEKGFDNVANVTSSSSLTLGNARMRFSIALA